MINRGRFQAQGNNTEKSESWATQNIIFKSTGIKLLFDLETQLTRFELAQRSIAIQKARNFVASCPIDGIPPLKKTYSNSLFERSIRIDIEVNAGIAFVTDK